MVRELAHVPVGLLFGLGFDTATEIGLLGLSATQASQGDALVAADISDLVHRRHDAGRHDRRRVHVGAYGWAFMNPLRKLWYNLTITAASIAVAPLIGGVEALGP